MTSGRPIQFRDYLPEVFQGEGENQFLGQFLRQFETLYEELQAAIEGTQGSGGIPDLFSPDTTPPPQFNYRAQPDFDYLEYLAGWLGLRLRAELIPKEGEGEDDYLARRLSWNRQFFKTAIGLAQQRGSLAGLQSLLQAWLKGDLLETNPPLAIITDLTRVHTDVETVFQINNSGETAILGFNTLLGEGAPFFFVVDLISDPAVAELRAPEALTLFQKAARILLDDEKPAYSYYQLRARAHTMQLAPVQVADEQSGEVYAQVGRTTLIWGEPWVYDSDR